jgi:hypothetical protein
MDNKNKNTDKLKKNKNTDKLKKNKNKNTDKPKKDKNKNTDKLKKKGGGISNLYKHLPLDVSEMIQDRALTASQKESFNKQKKNLLKKRLDYTTNLKKYKEHLNNPKAFNNKSLFSSIKEMQQFNIDRDKIKYVKRYMAKFQPENDLLKELYKIYKDQLPQTLYGKVNIDEIIDTTLHNNIFITNLNLKETDDFDDIKNKYIIFFIEHKEEISDYYNAVAYTKALIKNDRFHIEVMRRLYSKYFQELELESDNSLFPVVAATSSRKN